MGITKKQKEFYDYIVQYFEMHGHAPTQKEMRDHFELKSFGSVQKYLQYLIKEGLLESNWNERRGIQLQHQALIKEVHHHDDFISLPLLGDIAAGVPIEALEKDAEKVTISKALFPHFKVHEKYFALSVKGDSMINAGILDGDIVIIKNQKTAHNNQIVAAKINDEVTLKSFKNEKNQISLIASNPNYRPILINEESDFSILGILVGLVRTYA